MLGNNSVEEPDGYHAPHSQVSSGEYGNHDQRRSTNRTEPKQIPGLHTLQNFRFKGSAASDIGELDIQIHACRFPVKQLSPRFAPSSR